MWRKEEKTYQVSHICKESAILEITLVFNHMSNWVSKMEHVTTYL
jgi:hypothetical protein